MNFTMKKYIVVQEGLVPKKEVEKEGARIPGWEALRKLVSWYQMETSLPLQFCPFCSNIIMCEGNETFFFFFKAVPNFSIFLCSCACCFSKETSTDQGRQALQLMPGSLWFVPSSDGDLFWRWPSFHAFPECTPQSGHCGAWASDASDNFADAPITNTLLARYGGGLIDE